jgi:hypothetical protein
MPSKLAGTVCLVESKSFSAAVLPSYRANLPSCETKSRLDHPNYIPLQKDIDGFTERDGSKGPPAGNRARCNRTNTPHSKAMQRKAKPNQTPQTHTRGSRQA